MAKLTNNTLQDVLETLDIVKAQLDNVTKERAREVAVLEADLESEKGARRSWQDKATNLRERLLLVVLFLRERVLFSAADLLLIGTSAVCACIS